MNKVWEKRDIFTFFGLYFIGLGFLSVILTLTGIFYREINLVYIIGGFIFLLYLLRKSLSSILASLKFWPIILITILVIIVWSVFTTPTIFSGRDQGSFSEAAIRLSQNHKLTYSSPAEEEFFKIYGPGQALNFPGFSYTSSGQLITSFPLGYTAWLAAFYSFFGLTGLILANAIVCLWFFISFFLIARLYLRPALAVWTWLLALTSFVFLWFFKFTLSENLALALFWFGLWTFVLFWKNENKLYLAASLLSFTLMAFARIEAWAILFMVLIAFYLKYGEWKIIRQKLWNVKLLIPLFILILLFLLDLIINLPFYKTFAKGLMNAFLPGKNESDAPSYYLSAIVYRLKVFNLYAILDYLVLALAAIIYFLFKKNYRLLLPLLIALPALIYLINPGISADQPWMLRRYVFIIFPLVLFYTVLLLDKLFKRQAYAYVILFLLLVANVAVSFPYLTVSENKDLLGQVNDLGNNFSSADLILVDQQATGSGWSMMSGPLSFLDGKQAVYFINPADLDKINLNRFNHIYFIIPDQNFDWYTQSGLAARLDVVKNYRIQTTYLGTETGQKSDPYHQPVGFPLMENILTYGKIYELNK